MKIFKDSSLKAKPNNKSKVKPFGLKDSRKNNLEELNPMAFALLALRAQDSPENDFISRSLKAISESPHMLTDKWVLSINNFVDAAVKAALLDPPDIKEGERVVVSNVVLIKVSRPKEDSAYPMPALICADEKGWKYYFKTSKAYDFKVGQKLSFKATLSAHKEGISFMRRPACLKVIS